MRKGDPRHARDRGSGAGRLEHVGGAQTLQSEHLIVVVAGSDRGHGLIVAAVHGARGHGRHVRFLGRSSVRTRVIDGVTPELHDDESLEAMDLAHRPPMVAGARARRRAALDGPGSARR